MEITVVAISCFNVSILPCFKKHVIFVNKKTKKVSKYALQVSLILLQSCLVSLCLKCIRFKVNSQSYKKKKKKSQMVVAHAFNPNTQRERQVAL